LTDLGFKYRVMGVNATMNIKIESGVPMPRPAVLVRKRYPWAEMKVGDSFVMEEGQVGERREMSLRSIASIAGRKHQMKFSVTAGECGVRVWRAA